MAFARRTRCRAAARVARLAYRASCALRRACTGCDVPRGTRMPCALAAPSSRARLRARLVASARHRRAHRSHERFAARGVAKSRWRATPRTDAGRSRRARRTADGTRLAAPHGDATASDIVRDTTVTEHP
ncbi:hypothetical protein BURMUCGD1_6079 [Burkholderia multivorans CGD1]|nr:hypothetical protein BURMUCGD1_6079 [Burkholderia multivorans CGD1]